MKHRQLIKFLLIITISCCVQISALAQDNVASNSNDPRENVILRWNRVLKETVSTPGQHPATIMPVRSYAMMHAAMFDAVNSIDQTYTPYLTDGPGIRTASIEAAAAKAARDVLAALYPNRRTIFDTELAFSVNGLEDNRVRQGLKVGAEVAEQLLAARANDGWNAVPTSYVLPMFPGNWQPTPPNFTLATFTHYPAVTPFALTSGTQFMPPPPPALTSAVYAADLNEVKAIGSATSTTRTADQTQVARLWAGVNTPTNFLLVWNNVARSVALAQGTNTVENARLFALINFSLHDALQTAFASKFPYGLWRPVTAIQRAGEDDNPDTEPDSAWASLIPAPPYPSYAGNNAAIGTSQSTILALFFGRDDIRFVHTWEGAGGATRSYAGFTAMADEEARSRVYGGIHYTFDNVAGQSIGRNVAHYIFQNFLRPRQQAR
jgi:hypothetical protein